MISGCLCLRDKRGSYRELEKIVESSNIIFVDCFRFVFGPITLFSASIRVEEGLDAH